MANETVADDMRAMFENVRRWKEDEIYFAENTFLKLAYVVTNDKTKIGTIGIKRDIFVEFISEEQGKLWDAATRCQHPN